MHFVLVALFYNTLYTINDIYEFIAAHSWIDVGFRRVGRGIKVFFLSRAAQYLVTSIETYYLK